MAPVVTHREREARALHGARSCAVAGGLRARTCHAPRKDCHRLVTVQVMVLGFVKVRRF